MSNPSLILPQSPAYGEDYVYAAQVEDGAVPLYNVLPLTFTRASGGTRINKDGLVQNMPYNLATYSENFSANYIDINSTISSNTTTAPNGTTTAESILETTATDVHAIRGDYTETSGIAYTYSVYAKTISGRNIQVLGSNGFTGPIARVNLSNGTLLSGSTGASVESVGNGWYRISITETTTTTSIRVIIYSMDGTATTFAGSTSNGIYIWGAQLNIGSTAQPYLATTDRLNMPRITYPVGGGCGALLLEKQSTNVNTYSQSINATNYVVSNTTTSENILLSPDGTINATKLIENTSNSSHGIIKFASLGGTVDNSAYCTSVFVKAEGRSRVYFYDNNQAQGGLTYFNLATGSVVSGGGKIENYGNGWYRLTIFCLKDNSTTANIQLYLQDDAGNVTYTGNGTSGIGIYGMQCEASSYATSYIPTTSTSATRIKDACYKTGISNLIGQTSGTIFLEMTPVGLITTYTERLIKIYGGGQEIGLQRYADSRLVGYGYLGGASNEWTFDIANVFTSTTQSVKIAMAYASNDVAIYVNGVQKGTDSSASMFSLLSAFTFAEDITGDLLCSQKIQQAILYTTRLTNAELQALTS